MRVRYMKESVDILLDSPYVIDHPEEVRGKWAACLGTEKIALEIGCGMGHFIGEMAQRSLMPETENAQGDYFGYGFIGLERIGTILAKASTRLEKLAQRQSETADMLRLRLIRGDAKNLCEYFAPGEVDTIFLNFSDPWPKKHHAKRRLTADGFLVLYRQILKPGGILQLKTDNDGLYAFSLTSLRDNGWEILRQSSDLHESPYAIGNVMTEYEMKFSSRGKNINFLQARYVGPTTNENTRTLAGHSPEPAEKV